MDSFSNSFFFRTSSCSFSYEQFVAPIYMDLVDFAIRQCTFIDNNATSQSCGGVIWNQYYQNNDITGLMSDCYFANNMKEKCIQS